MTPIEWPEAEEGVAATGARVRVVEISRKSASAREFAGDQADEGKACPALESKGHEELALGLLKGRADTVDS